MPLTLSLPSSPHCDAQEHHRGNDHFRPLLRHKSSHNNCDCTYKINNTLPSVARSLLLIKYLFDLLAQLPVVDFRFAAGHVTAHTTTTAYPALWVDALNLVALDEHLNLLLGQEVRRRCTRARYRQACLVQGASELPLGHLRRRKQQRTVILSEEDDKAAVTKNVRCGKAVFVQRKRRYSQPVR